MCLSVNDAVLHGTPTQYRLREGDLLSVDCGATVDGWTGDAAVSFCVGSTAAEDARLLERTEHALRAGIAAARDDARIGDVSAAIGAVMAWGVPCTGAHTSPTTVAPVAGCGFAPG